MFKAFGAMAFVAVILNFALIGGLIYFVFWCLKHFGVIS